MNLPFSSSANRQNKDAEIATLTERVSTLLRNQDKMSASMDKITDNVAREMEKVANKMSEFSLAIQGKIESISTTAELLKRDLEAIEKQNTRIEELEDFEETAKPLIAENIKAIEKQEKKIKELEDFEKYAKPLINQYEEQKKIHKKRIFGIEQTATSYFLIGMLTLISSAVSAFVTINLDKPSTSNHPPAKIENKGN